MGTSLLVDLRKTIWYTGDISTALIGWVVEDAQARVQVMAVLLQGHPAAPA